MACTVAILATLDTKGEEAKYVIESIAERGHRSLVIDCGVLGKPSFEPSISREEVAKAAEARLRSSQFPDLKNVSCECDDGMLILHGRLSSYYHKQLAQETVLGVEGVVQVVNRTEVEKPPSLEAE